MHNSFINNRRSLLDSVPTQNDADLDDKTVAKDSSWRAAIIKNPVKSVLSLAFLVVIFISANSLNILNPRHHFIDVATMASAPYSGSKPYALRRRVGKLDFVCEGSLNKMQSQYDNAFEKWLTKHWFETHFRWDGVFVEIGGLDGVRFSNTYWLERCLGWTGLLIEAFPQSAATCRRNRGDHCIHTAVCEKTGYNEDFVEFVGTGDGLSYEKEVGETFNADKHFSRKKPVVERVPCKPISEIFAENGIGPIDIWSLDVENAEVKVLRTMDWVQNPVNLVFVEHSKTGPGRLAHKDEMERAKLFEEACMEPLSYDIIDNKLWYNPYFPMPACLGRKEAAAGRLKSPTVEGYEPSAGVPMNPKSKFDWKRACREVVCGDHEFEDWLLHNWVPQHFLFSGFYIETGGNFKSRTALLHDCMGWSGLQIEKTERAFKDRIDTNTCKLYEVGAPIHSSICENAADGCAPLRDMAMQYDLGAIEMMSLKQDVSQALKTHDWIKNPVHLLVLDKGVQHDKLLSNLCMQPISSVPTDASFVAFENVNYPDPACTSASLL